MTNLIHTLPVLSQIVLVFGYLGYRLSSGGVGVADHHTGADKVMQSFVFGAIAVFFAYLLSLSDATAGNATYAYLLAGGCGSLLVAGLWARKGREIFIKNFRRFDDKLDDGMPDAWSSILGRRKGWWEIHVYLNNGDVLKCNFDKVPRDFPDRRGILSKEGDLVIYVTGLVKNGKSKDPKIIEHSQKHKKYTMTYVPASSIKYVHVQTEQ